MGSKPPLELPPLELPPLEEPLAPLEPPDELLPPLEEPFSPLEPPLLEVVLPLLDDDELSPSESPEQATSDVNAQAKVTNPAATKREERMCAR